MFWIINAGILIGVFYIGKVFLLRIDSTLAEQSIKHKYLVSIAAIYLFCVAGTLQYAWEGVFWVSLALAAYSDYVTREIYDFIYFPTGMICIYQLLQGGIDASVIEMIIFCCIQMLLFRHYYGVSDCIAFSMCAMYLAVHGGRMLEYWLHMFWAFLLLLMIQALKRNIDKRGRLKKPVAFIPYIAAAMLFHFL